MLQQLAGDAGDDRIAGLAPRLDPRANPVDQRHFDEDAGIVEAPRLGRGDQIPHRPPAFLQSKHRCWRS
jgi:hypothetical protein